MQTGGKKMAEQTTLKQVLERAIQKEIEAQKMYTGLSQKVKDEAVKGALLKLSREEKGHQNRLEGYLERGLGDGSLSIKHVVDYKIAELAGPTEPSAEMGLKETFLVAANREKAAHALYTGLGGVHPAGGAKMLLLP